jgi:SAM-dependent methyltransferase
MRTLRQQRAVHHPLFARCYARVGHLMDAEIGDHRQRLLAGLAGRVLEVGAGNGLNFPHYPATVTEVLAIEPEPYLRRQALAAASQAPVPIRVVAGTAEALPAPDGADDVVVASLVLSRSPTWTRSWPRPVGCCAAGPLAGPAAAPLGVVGGCHPNRDTVAAITAAGLRLVQLDRFDLPAMPPLARPHVLGVAERGS